MDNQQAAKSISVCGILSAVFGGIALLTSFVPIINNASAIFGLVGAVLGIVGLVSTRSTGRKSGRAVAVVGTLISGLSVVIVLMLQAQWAAALA